MTNEDIQELIRIVRDTGIAELEVQRGDARVRITASRPEREVVVPTMMPLTVSAASAAMMPAPVAVTAPVETAAPASTATIAAAAKEAAFDDTANDVSVKSPIVGTYYDAPSPGMPPFVKVGDRVEPKQVICIIESMKLMNEIEAETAGTLVAKFVESGRPVEYGQALFTIRPLSA